MPTVQRRIRARYLRQLSDLVGASIVLPRNLRELETCFLIGGFEDYLKRIQEKRLTHGPSIVEALVDYALALDNGSGVWVKSLVKTLNEILNSWPQNKDAWRQLFTKNIPPREFVRVGILVSPDEVHFASCEPRSYDGNDDPFFYEDECEWFADRLSEITVKERIAECFRSLWRGDQIDTFGAWVAGTDRKAALELVKAYAHRSAKGLLEVLHCLNMDSAHKEEMQFLIDVVEEAREDWDGNNRIEEIVIAVHTGESRDVVETSIGSSYVPESVKRDLLKKRAEDLVGTESASNVVLVDFLRYVSALAPLYSHSACYVLAVENKTGCLLLHADIILGPGEKTDPPKHSPPSKFRVVTCKGTIQDFHILIRNIETGVLNVDGGDVLFRHWNQRWSNVSIGQTVPAHLKRKFTGGKSVFLAGPMIDDILKEAHIDSGEYFRKRDSHVYADLEDLAISTIGQRLNLGINARINVIAPSWLSWVQLKLNRRKTKVDCTFECPIVFANHIDLIFKFSIDGPTPDEWMVKPSKHITVKSETRCRVSARVKIPCEPEKPHQVSVFLIAAGYELQHDSLSIGYRRGFLDRMWRYVKANRRLFQCLTTMLVFSLLSIASIVVLLVWAHLTGQEPYLLLTLCAPIIGLVSLLVTLTYHGVNSVRSRSRTN